MLLLRKLKHISCCDIQSSKITKQKSIPSIKSPSQENISQNVMQGQTKSSQIATHQVPELENVQNEKRLLCKQIYGSYFNEDSETLLYLIPISNSQLRTRLANALVSDEIPSESLIQIIDDTLEDSLVWIKLSELCDKFLKQNVLQSQNSSVAKSVAVLLSIL